MSLGKYISAIHDLTDAIWESFPEAERGDLFAPRDYIACAPGNTSMMHA